jgi:adenine-specific DNA-methyltransferase
VIDEPEALAMQIDMFVKSEKDGAETENILYELLLKFGQPLTTPIENLEVAGTLVHAINKRSMLFVLERFTLDMIEPLKALNPREIVVLDSVFHDSDELKSNFDLQCRDADVRFICI